MISSNRSTCSFQLIFIAITFSVSTLAFSQESNECAPVAIPGHYGPYDYVTEHGKLIIVESAHFPPRVEALVSGSTGTLGGDLSYTLNASPNHHRALMALMRLGVKTKSSQPHDIRFPIDCYFDRALRFKPNDGVVRTVYGLWLGKSARMPLALEQLRIVSERNSDNALLQMSVGLAYLELNQIEEARKQAELVISLGLRPTALIDGLKRKNSWDEPPR